MTTPEIEELKSLIEQKYGKMLCTTTDFEEFSIYLKQKWGKSISSSTLKRLYGYVNDDHKPRNITLDALAQYIGYNNYAEFTKWLKNSTKYNSSFFMAQQVISNDLQEGKEISIGWSPNRILRLRYLGESTYEVLTRTVSREMNYGIIIKSSCYISVLLIIHLFCKYRHNFSFVLFCLFCRYSLDFF